MSTAAPPAPPVTETASELRMPSLGADMDYGTLVRWKIAVGSTVRRGDVVADVETEKGVFEMEATLAGTVAELIVAPGTRVKVGTPLARFGAEGAKAMAPPPPAAEPRVAPVALAAPALPAPPVAPVAPAPTIAPAAPVVPTAPAAPVAAVAPATQPHERLRVSPAARKLAEAEHVELAQVGGTGPEGTILLDDVKRAIAARGAAPPAPAVAPEAPEAPEAPARPDAMRAMRQAVAAAVSRSKREIPHYYLSNDVDLSPTLRWLERTNAARPITDRILPAALLLKSVAVALRDHRALNGFWIDGELRSADAIHLGIAISLRGGGLIAPAIHDADTLALEAMMRALGDLVRRARGGGLRTSEMTDATITVSSLGDDGVDSLFGVIYPPQVALVGFGGITERPWAERDALSVRRVVTMTLAADHRATDGHYGSRFLRAVAELLQKPETL